MESIEIGISATDPDLSQIVFLVDRCKGVVASRREHTPIVRLLDEHDGVAVLVDGFCSTTAGDGLRVRFTVQPIFEASGLKPAILCYKKRATMYNPSDTISVSFDELVDIIDRLVRRFKSARHVILLGYSFGGLIVSEWLYEAHRDGVLPDNIAGAFYVASPIRLSGTAIRYRVGAREDAKEAISKRVEFYRARPEVVVRIAPTVIIRCESDRVIADEMYSLNSISSAVLPDEFRPPEYAIPNVDHFTILAEQSTIEPYIRHEVSQMLALAATSR